MDTKALIELLKNGVIHTLVQRHLGGAGPAAPEFSSLYNGLAKQLQADRFVVPVFGVQGSGKSTFLNALLFNRPVLPVEADETTCVPVEIVWAEIPSACARILHLDNREEFVAADEEHLRHFVDNASNPGNEMGVSRVILESACELLKSGMVLVDLPGIGSLTAKNVETTERYLRDAIGVIFMLRPAITRSDSIAIQLQWPRLSYAFFIQNVWNDESEVARDEGLAYNVKVLREIAAKARVPLTDGPRIYPVNAYAAWCDKLAPDDASDKESGMDSVLSALLEGVCEWPKRLADGVSQKLLLDLEKTHESIRCQIADLSKTRAELETEMSEEQRRFDDYIRGSGEKVASAHQEASLFRAALHSQIGASRSSIKKDLRNKMRAEMRGGIVDGERLETALKDHQSLAFEDAIAVIHEQLSAFADKLKSKFENVKPWDGQATFRASTFSTPESTKYENFLSPGAGAVGGILGMVAGPVLLGLLVSNPAGWVVLAAGAAVGAGGGFFGEFIGRKGREAVLDKRIKEVEPRVFDAINIFVTDVCGQMESNVTAFVEGITVALDAWLTNQENNFNQEKKRRKEAYEANDEEKHGKVDALKADLTSTGFFLSHFNEQ